MDRKGSNSSTLNAAHPVLLFASSNSGKLVEVRSVAACFGIHIVSPADLCSPNATRYGIASPLAPLREVEEPAATYRENAAIKARAYFEWSGLPSLADDTGLEVSALRGEPGVRSARYAGEPSDAQANIAKVLRKIQGKPDRSAKFVCVLVAVLADGKVLEGESSLRGTIRSQKIGQGGFGYDSIFEPEGRSHTLAELKDPRSAVFDEDLKTHRVLALEKLLPELHRFLVADGPHTAR